MRRDALSLSDDGFGKGLRNCHVSAIWKAICGGELRFNGVKWLPISYADLRHDYLRDITPTAIVWVRIECIAHRHWESIYQEEIAVFDEIKETKGELSKSRQERLL